MFGQACGQNDGKLLSRILASSLSANILISLVACGLVLLVGNFFGISNFAAPYVIILIILTAFPTVLSPLYNATLRTGVIALSSVLSAALRLLIGLALLCIGAGFTGVVLAFVIAGIVQAATHLAFLRGTVSLARPSIDYALESIKQGIPSWIPHLVTTAGPWLGVLGIYGLTGAEQAGTYYIAFLISQIVYTLPLSLLGLMFPVLSGMKDGGKRSVSKSICLTFVIIAPLAAVVIAFPQIPLSILGSSYADSSYTLQLLMMGCLIAPVSYGFNSLVYAYGHYRYVTLLGLATNVPRILLYPLLVTLYGNNGAALSYISGLFLALLAVYFMARHIGYTVGWGSSFLFIVIPLLVALVVMFLNIHWVVGTALILVLSLLAYTRLNLLTKSDLAMVSSSFLSRKQLDQFYPYIKYAVIWKDL